MKIAVIGCGKIANLQHLRVLSGNPDVEIAYAVDIIPERAEAAVRDFGAEQALTDYRVALADPSVEAVWVLTPNLTHHTITMDALHAGKHVFCEKPITIDYPKSLEMADLAEKKGLILNIGVCNRFNRSVEMIRDLIASGALGNVYHVVASFREYRSIPGLGGYFTTKAEAGGGVLIDWGVHFIDLILYALGEPTAKAVSAVAYNALGKDIDSYVFKSMWAGPPVKGGVCDVDDFISGLIRTDGTNISFNGAWAQNVNESEMWIDFLGDKAGIRLQYGGMFTLCDAEGGTLRTVKPDFAMNDMYADEDAAFVESVRLGIKNRGNIVHVLETAKVMDAAYASAEQNKEIAL